MTRTTAPRQDPPRHTQRRLLRTLLLTTLTLAAVLIAVDAGAALTINTTHIDVDQSSIDLRLMDTAEDNNTLAICAWFDDFDALRVYTSTTQGETFRTQEFHNGTLADSVYGDNRACAIDVGPDGETIATVHPLNGTTIAVQASTDGGETWTNHTAALNNTNDEFQRRTDIAVATSETWYISHLSDNGSGSVAQVQVTNNGGANWTTTRFHDSLGSIAIVCDGEPGEAWVVAQDSTDHIARLHRTTDSGANWTTKTVSLQTSDNWAEPADCYEPENAPDSHFWYALHNSDSTQMELMQTTNNGDDVSLVSTTSTVDSSIEGYAYVDGNSSQVFSWGWFQIDGEGFWENTSDGGSSFEDIQTFISSRQPGRDDSPGSGNDDTGDMVTTFLDGTFHFIVDGNGTDIDLYKQQAPPPGVEASLTTFGNGQSVRTDWDGDPTIYVRDSQAGDRIFKLDPSLNVDRQPRVCNENIEESDDFLVWLFHLLTDLQLEDPPETSQGLDVSRNTTFNTLHTCEITLEKIGSDVTEGGTVLRNGDTLSFVNYNVTGVEQAPIHYDAVDSINWTFGITGGNPAAGGGNWGYISSANSVFVSGDLHETEQNAILPRWENLTDVAVDKAIDRTTRLFCVTSSSNGTGCWNQNGGEIATNASLTADTIQVYQGQVYLLEGATLTKLDVSTSGFTEVDNATFSVVSFHMSKDGSHLLGCDTDDLTILERSTLDEVVTTVDFATNIRDCDMDASNNYAYAVDSTTLYKLPVFNHTTNADEEGNIIGDQNPEQAFDTDSTGDTDGEDDDGTTEPTGSAVTDLSPAADALGISEDDFAVFMSALAVVIMGGGAFFISAQVTGSGSLVMGTLGAFAGAGLAVAYGWMPDWLLFLLVLIIGGFIAWQGTNGGGV